MLMRVPLVVLQILGRAEASIRLASPEQLVSMLVVEC